MLIKRSSIPVSTRGVAGTASVAVRENGQIGFSSVVAKALNGFKYAMIDWEPKSRAMTFTPADEKKLPKGWVVGDLAEIKASKGKGDRKDRYISLSGLFKLPEIAYDYKAAGTHTFPATVSDAGVVSFQLPTSMVKIDKPKRTRKPKGTAGGLGPALVNGSAQQSEPQLEVA